MAIRIGIDLMGNENKPEDLLKGIRQFTDTLNENAEFIFFAIKKLESKLKKFEKNSKIKIEYVDQYITMQNNPLVAIRRKKNSSMIVGMNHLKDDKIDAFITLGNTGAITMGSIMIFNTIKSISRPALLALIPTKKKPTCILDVGANVHYLSVHLVEYAYLGAAFHKTINNKIPRVGLLNIGSEQKKGTLQHQEAFEELSQNKTDNFDFLGNIEAKEIFDGIADVVVTDGFSGNIFVKTLEGSTNFILDKIYQKITTKNKMFFILDNFKKNLYLNIYSGALLVGTEKIIIKCHSYSSINNLTNAIINAINFVKMNIISSIKANL